MNTATTSTIEVLQPPVESTGLYSVPGDLIGTRVEVRADRSVVRIFARSRLVKVHPRMAPGHRSTDPEDLPSEKTAYAMRDLDHLRRLAASYGEAIGVYAAAVLDHPLPWTKMRQVYALLGLVKKWGPDRVEAACRKALDAEAIHIPLIGRMLDRGTEDQQETPPAETNVVTARFARNPSHFALGHSDRRAAGNGPDAKRPADGVSEARFRGGVA